MLTLFGRQVPCGCESRKDIMFTQGGVTPLQFFIGVGVTSTILVAAWHYGHRTIPTPNA